MNLNKIKVSNEVTQKLRVLKSRTGLTPNILCRLGLCLSLNEPGIPDIKEYTEDGMEFNRYTLTGQYDSLFISLLKERCFEDGLEIEDSLIEQFLAHINRGVPLLFNRIRTLADFRDLFLAKAD